MQFKHIYRIGMWRHTLVIAKYTKDCACCNKPIKSGDFKVSTHYHGNHNGVKSMMSKLDGRSTKRGYHLHCVKRMIKFNYESKEGKRKANVFSGTIDGLTTSNNWVELKRSGKLKSLLLLAEEEYNIRKKQEDFTDATYRD